MKIGELAKSTDCDVETIRYYEKAGLLDAPARDGNGYREYQVQHQERLQFIRHCRSLQMGLADIRILLDLKKYPEGGCQRINELLDHHLEQTRERITVLRTLEQQLSVLRHQCDRPHSVQECGILQTLNEAAEGHQCVCHASRTAVKQLHEGQPRQTKRA
jgi:Cd(II)/Pb(II)-responsive transcriptional regulator